jgi:hypothetical protein
MRKRILLGIVNVEPDKKQNMTTTSQSSLTRLVLWAVAWSAALIGSAVVLKGNPLKDWIQAALFIGAMTFWLWQSQRAARH